jgi:hypothetical protein
MSRHGPGVFRHGVGGLRRFLNEKEIFKTKKRKSGIVELVINSDSKAYKKWREFGGKGGRGIHLYAVMVYSLYSSIKEIGVKDTAKFIRTFSSVLKEKSSEIF